MATAHHGNLAATSTATEPASSMAAITALDVPTAIPTLSTRAFTSFTAALAASASIAASSPARTLATIPRPQLLRAAWKRGQRQLGA